MKEITEKGFVVRYVYSTFFLQLWPWGTELDWYRIASHRIVSQPASWLKMQKMPHPRRHVTQLLTPRRRHLLCEIISYVFLVELWTIWWHMVAVKFSFFQFELSFFFFYWLNWVFLVVFPRLVGVNFIFSRRVHFWMDK